MLRALAAASLAVTAALIGGCARPEGTALAGARIPADRYAQTFQAARQVLREYRFTTDRVDAPQGVLTSLPHTTPGVFRPWATHSGSAAAWEDTLNYQQRSIQVVFVTGDTPQRVEGGRIIPATDPDRDLVQMPRETTMLVRVAVDRIERDGRRVSADSVRIERQAQDPVMLQNGDWPRYLVQEPDDTVFAADLLRVILARSETANASTQAAPAAEPVAPTP